jgi:hypothetical protein
MYKIVDKVKFSENYIRLRKSRGSNIICNRNLIVVGFSRNGGIRVVTEGKKTPMVYNKLFLQNF